MKHSTANQDGLLHKLHLRLKKAPKDLSTQYKLRANTFMNNHSTLSNANHSSPMKILHKGLEDIHLYDKQNKKRNANFSLLHEETQDFLQSYSKIQKKNKEPSSKKNSHINPFCDIINQYRRKGYKIPDLSIESNLFNQSVCLIEQKKIGTYYQYYKDLSKITDKGALYIDKVDCYLKKYKAEEGKTKKPFRGYQRRSTLFRQSMLQMAEQETQRENEELEKYNRTMEAFITTSLVDIEKIVPKNPKTTKNNQTNSTFFESSNKNSHYKDSAAIATLKLLKSPTHIHRFLIEASNNNNTLINKLPTKRTKTTGKGFHLISSQENFLKESGHNKQKLSIDSREISIIERPSSRRLESGYAVKRNEAISAIRDQINLDEPTRRLIKDGESSSYLKLIKNKIQFKVNQFDYESLRRIETLNPSNSNHFRIKLRKLQRVVKEINRLDKDLIQATNNTSY